MARTSWLDESQKNVRIDDYARQLTSFVEAMADGRVDDGELKAQEQRVVDLIQQIEPQLDDSTHERMTSLLCEISAFNVMQVLHSLREARPASSFRG